ncbi:hypothetical protein HPTD01_1753 [Halomonas sp. TD01]|nr:hypothetical protein GME_19137 [Halomonas sp. TD01]CAH1043275.1 hypothetical protein HPTD01_1753 [Halomonas sp. TD01]
MPMLRIDQGNENEEKQLSAYITDALERIIFQRLGI